MVSVDKDPYWADLPTRFDSEIKQRCLDDLKAYYSQLCDRLEAVPMGDPQRLKLMTEINGILGAIRSLVKASDEEVEQSHKRFVEAAVGKGFRLPSQAG